MSKVLNREIWKITKEGDTTYKNWFNILGETENEMNNQRKEMIEKFSVRDGYKLRLIKKCKVED